ncbi:MAG: class I SAM-dependent methyltransferase [Deltaproteobacteria bacterium]|nr:class I SAM-dependent methyltransferase [Deltaproteobacteria bacterium]
MTESSTSSSSDYGVACKLCGCQDAVLYHEQGYRRLLSCRGCGLLFAHPLPDESEKEETERQAYVGEVLPEAAEFFESCNADFVEDEIVRGFRRVLDALATAHENSGQHGDRRLLDVGAGTGLFMHLAREQGWRIKGLDLCELSREKARAEFGVEVDVGDFRSAPYQPESFDCITMLDVLEHSLDPAAFLARALELLKPGGLLYVAVPNQRSLLANLVDRWIWLGLPARRWFLERLYVSPHIFYFHPRLLKRALEDAGFEVVSVRGGNVYLGRYRLPWWMRVPLELILNLGTLVGRSARIQALARRPVD